MTTLESLLDEEERIQFAHFDHDLAMQIGLELVSRARADALAIAIDVSAFGQCLFHAAMPGASPDNAAWIRRKINVVHRFGRSSMYMGELCRSRGTTLEEKYMVDPSEFSPHGGSFPVRLRGSGLVGTVTVSGLPQLDDHRLVVSVLEQVLSGD
ncbi:uncharacterized protein (UPF0303 family) [Hoeflea marina]|uniref:UPF0303 protein DFR52_1011266 n=1 Tax=Hoeflea marina TaxID=274592 RepID=A0A317PUG0_9HYPH|nr:heme-degrading domain-containing protein [Hoeflea marina]PWW04567.1 uncharacterized protein (UPF0303 family) [Hoeflea marina]